MKLKFTTIKDKVATDISGEGRLFRGTVNDVIFKSCSYDQIASTQDFLQRFLIRRIGPKQDHVWTKVHYETKV